MTRIFISYRRHDTADAAGDLHEGLTRYLPEAEIFIDVASLAPADDWMRQVVHAVRSADWCLVLIGRNWLERCAAGKLRLDDRSDVVRLEVSTAITHGIPTLPITVDDAPMPAKELLPLSVAWLIRLQREVLSTARFETDVRRISTVVKGERKNKGRTPMPPELTGFWAHTTAESGSSYEFSVDGTYVYSGMLNQKRPTGLYTFEYFEEGIVDVEVNPSGVMRLRPLRASANQKDIGRPETGYSDSPRELVDKTLAWRLLTKPPRLMLRAPGESEAAYDLEWRGGANSDPTANTIGTPELPNKSAPEAPEP